MRVRTRFGCCSVGRSIAKLLWFLVRQRESRKYWYRTIRNQTVNNISSLWREYSEIEVLNKNLIKRNSRIRKERKRRMGIFVDLCFSRARQKKREENPKQHSKNIFSQDSIASTLILNKYLYVFLLLLLPLSTLNK